MILPKYYTVFYGGVPITSIEPDRWINAALQFSYRDNSGKSQNSIMMVFSADKKFIAGMLKYWIRLFSLDPKKCRIVEYIPSPQ